MKRRKILLQWVGKADLLAMASSLPKNQKNEIFERFRIATTNAAADELGNQDDMGPTKTLLDDVAFDEIYLLSNFPKKWGTWFAKWLGKKVTVCQVDLVNPADHASVMKVAEDELTKALGPESTGNCDLCIHLSPGTPAMHAIWLLLGKTRFPATFYETGIGGKSWISSVPFNLVDVIPEVLKDPDLHLQHLAMEPPSSVEGFEDIAGNSLALRDVVGRAKCVSMRSISVLLLGETGVGKDMFAQAIHQASPRRSGPNISVNCAALSETLLESELFGHKKGAFTGADRDREGAFEAAHGGTLFLDEIGECSLETQAKLLRVLQPITKKGPSLRSVVRLGETQVREVDVRIIAATNRELYKEIGKGNFREDLYHRLANVSITIPPLRERKSDIPLIANHLLGIINNQFQSEPGHKHKSFSPATVSFVKQQRWVGNVRQLYNAILNAVLFSKGEQLSVRDFQNALGELSDPDYAADAAINCELGGEFNLTDYLAAIEKGLVLRAMEEAHGKKVEATKLLGLQKYQTLDGKLKRFGISKPSKSESK